MNELKMDIRQSIETLTRQGRSQRQIARDLGINRETVARYRRGIREAEDSKPAKAPAGCFGSSCLAVEESTSSGGAAPPAKPAIAPTGRRSLCEPFEEAILAKLEAGLSAQRIYQDLVADHQFEGGYDSNGAYLSRRLSRVGIFVVAAAVGHFGVLVAGFGEEGKGFWSAFDGAGFPAVGAKRNQIVGEDA